MAAPCSHGSAAVQIHVMSSAATVGGLAGEEHVGLGGVHELPYGVFALCMVIVHIWLALWLIVRVARGESHICHVCGRPWSSLKIPVRLTSLWQPHFPE